VFPQWIKPFNRLRTLSGRPQPSGPSVNKQPLSSTATHKHKESQAVLEEQHTNIHANESRQRLVRDKVNHKIWSVAVSQNKYIWAMDIPTQSSSEASRGRARRGLVVLTSNS